MKTFIKLYSKFLELKQSDIITETFCRLYADEAGNTLAAAFQATRVSPFRVGSFTKSADEILAAVLEFQGLKSSNQCSQNRHY
jgi:hypothetical protein